MTPKSLSSLINKYLSILYMDEKTKKDISGADCILWIQIYFGDFKVYLRFATCQTMACLNWLQKPFAEKQRNSKLKFIKIHVNQYFIWQLIEALRNL